MENLLEIEFGQRPNNKPQKVVLVVICIILLYFLYLFAVPPFSFKGQNPNGVYINIKAGMSARQVSNLLYENKVISSPSSFVSLVSLLGDDNNIHSGIYLFKSGLTIWGAERRIVKGSYGIEAKKITFPEGFTNIQIANRLEANLPGFDKGIFLNLASTSEGYLYPETYFFLPSDSEEVIFGKMRSTFDAETEKLKADFERSTKSQDEIIIMASIIEREVKSLEDKKIVSGILWDRIKAKMALQVDATLAYERGKDSYTLTSSDLKKDTPYNTYTRRGLPPTAISNPGFDSIDAALNPTNSQYVYFLTDRDGNVYYAKTYDEHLKNKAKYL